METTSGVMTAWFQRMVRWRMFGSKPDPIQPLHPPPPTHTHERLNVVGSFQAKYLWITIGQSFAKNIKANKQQQHSWSYFTYLFNCLSLMPSGYKQTNQFSFFFFQILSLVLNYEAKLKAIFCLHSFPCSQVMCAITGLLDHLKWSLAVDRR